MCKVDITKAVSQGDLSVDNVVIEYADDFVPKCTVHRLEYGQCEELGITACYVSRYEDLNLLDTDKIYYFQEKKVNEKYYLYDSNTTPILGLYITEPQNDGGAKGIKAKLTENNIFFVSGPLSGCSVAVLKKNENYFFVHAGAINKNPKNKIKATDVNKYIWKDLYNCCVCLDNQPHLYIKDILEWNDFIDALSTLGYSGTIISNTISKNDKKAYITDNTKFTVIDYYNEELENEYYYTHDVIAAVSLDGNLSVATREIFNYFEGEIGVKRCVKHCVKRGYMTN